MGIDNRIRAVVGRYHVGTDYLEVLRSFLKKLKGGRKWFLYTSGKKNRRGIISDIFACHKKNRDVYHAVMTGKF